MIKEENIRLIFGLKVKMLRQEKGLSLAELSNQTGISISYLNEIEKGKKYPKADKISLMANALDTQYDWLVSLKLSRKFGPLAELLKSNILNELPLEIFGLEPAHLLELIANAPTKLNVFISTLVEISRNYNLSVENFYFSALRSYQEMHLNYFGEIEAEAEKFRNEHFGGEIPTYEDIRDFMIKECGYQVNEKQLDAYPALKNFRAILRSPHKKPQLLINSRLNDQQKTFVFSRELAYHLMKLQERSYTYTWSEVNSFDEILNNFKATYFAGALLLPENLLVQDLKTFFASPKWSEENFMGIMYKYKSSPETFMQRLTSLLPKHFDLSRLFFLKMTHTAGSNYYDLPKELHLTGLHKPHATITREHYCRRWLSINLLNEMEAQLRHQTYTRPLCRAQVSDYMDAISKYFIITIARPQYPDPEFGVSISLGFLIDKTFREQVAFWDDPNVPKKLVNQTCERCPAKDCTDRAAPPVELERRLHEELIKKSLHELMDQ